MKNHPARRPPLVYVSGGCRSGKSAYAQRVAESLAQNCLYLATAEICDMEMAERVRLHRQVRGPNWRVYELSRKDALDLWRELPLLVRPGEALLFDCLGMWAALCMDGDSIPDDFDGECRKLLSALRGLDRPVVIVNSEVGFGMTPLTPAGRAFRDMAGLAGQQAAAFADSAVLMASGLPLALKGELPLAKA